MWLPRSCFQRQRKLQNETTLLSEEVQWPLLWDSSLWLLSWPFDHPSWWEGMPTLLYALARSQALPAEKNFTPLFLISVLQMESLLLLFGSLEPVWQPHQVWKQHPHSRVHFQEQSPLYEVPNYVPAAVPQMFTWISLNRGNNPTMQVLFSTVYSLETKAQRGWHVFPRSHS